MTHESFNATHDVVTTRIGKKGRTMHVAFPRAMTKAERKKAVSELFSMIRTVQSIK